MSEQGGNKPVRRTGHLSVAEQFNLRNACQILNAAFGFNTYQVGSSLTRADYRDVDLRCILDDTEFDTFIGKRFTPKHHLLNVAISEWLAERSGLPIDFQFQRQTEANAENPDGIRNFVGMPYKIGEQE